MDYLADRAAELEADSGNIAVVLGDPPEWHAIKLVQDDDVAG
ncbi:MAG: hypothetical protein WB765_14190 [Acidimicrobiales bacterium]